MRRNLLRFDPATLLATLLAGLLPSAMLVAISYLYVSSISSPLHEILVAEPLRKHLRDRCFELGDLVQDRVDSLRIGLATALADGAADGLAEDSRRDWDLIRELCWHFTERGSEAARGPEDHSRAAELILASLARETDEARREELLAALTLMPASLQDPVGFSYALEAGLRAEAAVPGAEGELLHHGDGIDPVTLDHWLESRRHELEFPGLPRALAVVTEPTLLTRGDVKASGESGLLRIGVDDFGTGMVVAEVDGAGILERVLAEVAEGAARTNPTLVLAATPVLPVPPEVGEARLTQPLPRPFERWSLTAESQEDEPLPLAKLRSLEGIHYFWGAVVVLAGAMVTSLLLAGIVARRVRVSSQKDDFLRLVSHELRTPITAIRVLAETLGLDRVRDAEDRRHLLRQLESESERLSDLVERVLDFGRAESGSGTREVVTNPGELVEEAVSAFGDQEDAGAPVVVRAAQEFHPVILDRVAVTGVVLNLLSNARKFSAPDAPIEITVGEESRHLFIEVKDVGIGMKRRELRRIFRTFYRASQSGGPPGFGLGLAYSKSVAEAHGGRMRVRSAPGKGSVFTLEIPLVPAKPEGGPSGEDTGR